MSMEPRPASTFVIPMQVSGSRLALRLRAAILPILNDLSYCAPSLFAHSLRTVVLAYYMAAFTATGTYRGRTGETCPSAIVPNSASVSGL